VFLVGAHGAVSRFVAAGIAALQARRIEPVGIITSGPDFAKAGLVSFDNLVIGGCDRIKRPLSESVREIANSTRALDPELVQHLGPTLEGWSDRFNLPAADAGNSAGLAAARDAIARFRRLADVARVVVVNLSSTDGDPGTAAHYASRAALEKAVASNTAAIPASVVYAMAAFAEGCPYVNFTPSIGGESAALGEIATAAGLPHCGKDGKTGETLLKTVLGPMFVARALRVDAWQGFNMLGNQDGRTLQEPGPNAAKIRDKDAPLRAILGDGANLRTRIDYVPSLDDWKVAWDYIHFTGFLDVRMTLSFLWQGCDSALAAPLVIDLVRLTAWAHQQGEVGALAWTAPFFKTPVSSGGPQTHVFSDQITALKARFA
jgi:myo-inositol-1-phosphate synthase